MKRYFPPPLRIDCDGLSKKRTIELADLLVEHFDKVELWCDEIVAHKPLSMEHYAIAWRIIDRFAVSAI